VGGNENVPSPDTRTTASPHAGFQTRPTIEADDNGGRLGVILSLSAIVATICVDQEVRLVLPSVCGTWHRTGLMKGQFA